MSDYSLIIYDSKIYINLQLSIYIRLRILQYFQYSIKTEIHFILIVNTYGLAGNYALRYFVHELGTFLAVLII